MSLSKFYIESKKSIQTIIQFLKSVGNVSRSLFGCAAGLPQ